MRLIIATSTVALAIFAAVAPQPAGRRNGFAIPLYKCESAFLNADQSVDFHAVDSHVASVDAKILRGFENYERNTGVKHPYAVERLQKRNNNIPLTNENGKYWYGAISVGNPNQSFIVVFDTGSGNFYLPGSTCETCMGHSLWDPTSSSTSARLNWGFSVRYADGSSAAGIFYTDDVSIAGFTVTNQVIGVATTYSSQLQRSRFPADGVMGMGFSTISESHISPVFQTLVFEHDIDPVFSFKLSSPGAELYIGGSNSSLYAGSFTYVPVTVPGFWQVTMDNVQGNDRTILSNVPAIIDTGTVHIRGIRSQVIALHILLGGKPVLRSGSVSYFAFPCNSFPTISLGFGGASFLIPPSAFNLGPVFSSSPMCASGIIPETDGAAFWTIGHIFLKCVYTTFDYGNQQIGFAQLAR